MPLTAGRYRLPPSVTDVAGKADLVGGNTFSGDQSGRFLDRGGAAYNSALFASLDALLTEIGAAKATILLAPGDTKTLSDDLTIPANVTLDGRMGVIATDGHTLTVAGRVVAGNYQVFDAAADEVILSPGAAERVNARWFGATGLGAADDSLPVAAAYAAACAGGGELYFAPGAYKGKFKFYGEAPVRGAGKRRTQLKPSDTSSYCVQLNGVGIGGDATLGAVLRDLSIVGAGKVGTGLHLGDRTSGSGFSNGLVESIEVSGFADNIFVGQATMCVLRMVYSYSGTHGIRFDGEANVTTTHFDTCRFRLNDYGAKLQAGHVSVWTNCNFESNQYKNLWAATGLGSGPTFNTFIGCWFENLIHASAHSCIHFEISTTVRQTKGMHFLFQGCVISSPNGYYDVYADAAQDVVFRQCAFSATADAFSSTKFGYATGVNAVRIHLIECGTTQALATEAMYASFPALTRVSGGVFGFRFEFTTNAGKRVTNFETVPVTAAAVTSLQVAHASAVAADTSGNSITLNSLTGGSDGQRVQVIKTSGSNTLTIKHDGTGTQKIFAKGAADIALTNVGAVTLVCHGGAWYEA